MHSLKDDIGYWFNRIRMQVHASFEKKLAEKNITIPQWCVLVSIYNQDAENVSELAKFIEIDKGAISRTVNQLVNSGYLEEKEGKDRRSSQLKLTYKGKLITPKLVDCANQNEIEFFQYLNKEDKNALKEIFKKIAEHCGIVQDGWLK